MTRARWLASAVATVSALFVVAGSVLIVNAASAAWTDVAETGRPGYLSLRSDPGSPHWTDLRPGDTEHWLIEASLGDADAAMLRLELSSEGALAGELTVSVSGCSTPYVQDGAELRCDGVSEQVLAESALAAVTGTDAGTHPLLDLHRDAPRYVAVTLAVAEDAVPGDVAGATVRIGIGLHAAGDDPADGDLAKTGADASDLFSVIILAAGLLGIGASAVLWRRGDRRGGTAHA